MDKYRFLLFDLDGTVTDSGPGIMNAAQIALSRYNIEEADSERLRLFVGPPLDKSFMERYGFSEEQAWEAIGYFREYYNKTGIFENSVYPGMDNLLKELKEAGYVLAIASSKPIVLIHRVLGHFDIDKYFDVVVGCELDGTRSKKSEVIEEVIRQLSELALERGLPEVKELSIMIGDRCYDVEGAHSFGMPCVGVLYGHGSREEMEEAGADYITETVETLGELFL
jgi:phosphoglycolate phosphatase